MWSAQANREATRAHVRDLRDHDAPGVSLWEATLNVADVLFEATHHRVFEGLLAPHLDAAREPVGVEQLQQRREAVRVAVMRRGRQEKPALEAVAQVADSGVAASTRAMVRLAPLCGD
jgi:hypothetical protein